MSQTKTRFTISEQAVKEFPILENFNSIIIPRPTHGVTEEALRNFQKNTSTEELIRLAATLNDFQQAFSDGILQLKPKNNYLNEWIWEDIYDSFCHVITKFCYYKGMTEQCSDAKEPEDEYKTKSELLEAELAGYKNGIAGITDWPAYQDIEAQSAYNRGWSDAKEDLRERINKLI